jgi:AcrR family transcriptional regulator
MSLPELRRVRLTPDARREQLLDLGVRLLSTRTLDELSVDVLAEEAGISRGLLYHYFGNKADFHRAVVRRAADEMIRRTRPDPSLPPLERLTASLEAYLGYVEENYAAYAALVHGAAGGNEVMREIYEDSRLALTGRIFESIDELGLRDGPAVRLLTNGWAVMVEETVLSWVPEQQIPRAELLVLLAAALPALLAELSGAGGALAPSAPDNSGY